MHEHVLLNRILAVGIHVLSKKYEKQWETYAREYGGTEECAELFVYVQAPGEWWQFKEVQDKNNNIITS